MRYLGADPSKPPDDVEAIVMFELNQRLVREAEKAS
jgi:hypothetical protein